ncbi:hypothetical protein [Mycobacterium sp. URHB0021]
MDATAPVVLTAANAPPSLAADAGSAGQNLKVLQWQQNQVQHDECYRPPVRARIVTEVAQLGSYTFTALRLNPLGKPIDVAVGDFLEAVTPRGQENHHRPHRRR